MLEQAVALAKELHKGQKRQSGEDYIHHPLAVMEILRKYEFPNEALICGVLHDVCEDTSVSNLQINELFGNRVGFVVNQLTKNKTPKAQKLQREYDELQAKGELNEYESLLDYIDFKFQLYLNRLSIGIIADARIMFVKMADQIHNVLTIHHCPTMKIHRKLRELELYYIPLYANRVAILSPLYEEKYWRMMEELLEAIEGQKDNIKK